MLRSAASFLARGVANTRPLAGLGAELTGGGGGGVTGLGAATGCCTGAGAGAGAGANFYEKYLLNSSNNI